jgi:hypothetical protein
MSFSIGGKTGALWFSDWQNCYEKETLLKDLRCAEVVDEDKLDGLGLFSFFLVLQRRYPYFQLVTTHLWQFTKYYLLVNVKKVDVAETSSDMCKTSSNHDTKFYCRLASK